MFARLHVSQAQDTSFYWNKDWTIGVRRGLRVLFPIHPDDITSRTGKIRGARLLEKCSLEQWNLVLTASF